MVKKRLNTKVIIAVSASIFAVIFIFIVFLCFIKFNNNVYDNISLNGEDVSGLTPEKLAKKVSDISNSIENNIVTYENSEDSSFNITSKSIDLKVDISKTCKNILSYGRSGNIFQDLIDIFDARANGRNFDLEVGYDSKKMNTLLKNIELTLDDKVVYDTYSIEGNKLILTKGRSGYILNYKETEEVVLNCFKNLIDKLSVLVLEDKDSKCLNVEDIKEKITKKAKDAYIDETKKPIRFVKEIEGIDVNSEELSEAIRKLDDLKYGEKVEVELNVIKPAVYLSDIYFDTYNDKLASYTTYFAGNMTNRSKNIEIASSYLNDKIVMPGEIFSFNDTIGDVTASKGYLMAATFSGGKVVDGLGGGVCQVSSTLYNTALLANLEIVERYAHSLPVSYVLPSRDATIFVGELDFRFKNTRNYPIKIVTSYSQTGMITISMYGKKEEKEYDIDIESHVIEELKPKTQYITDTSLEKGKEEVVQGGSSGAISEGYVTKRLDGKVVERKLLSRDVYSAVNKIVKVNR